MDDSRFEYSWFSFTEILAYAAYFVAVFLGLKAADRPRRVPAQEQA